MKLTKTFQFGKVALYNQRKINLVEIKIELKYDKQSRPVFSAMAGVWNSKMTDWTIGGQCLDIIWNQCKDELKNPKLYEKILGLWQRNHLNDMNAGTSKQESFKSMYKKEIGGYEYEKFREYLAQNNCLVDNGYEYGTSWVYRDISKEDLDQILLLLKDNEN